eukprot:2855275-Rhodomonas_salina.3
MAVRGSSLEGSRPISCPRKTLRRPRAPPPPPPGHVTARVRTGHRVANASSKGKHEACAASTGQSIASASGRNRGSYTVASEKMPASSSVSRNVSMM